MARIAATILSDVIASGHTGPVASRDEAPPAVRSAAPLDRNLQLIPYHQALTRAMVWLPIFVLYTQAEFGLSAAVRLGSVYYLFVVLLEVPSGWMSDRLGRVPTLRIAAIGFVAAQSCYLAADGRLWVVGLGQFFLATGFASLSGTDVTFHYDSLEAAGRSVEFAARQSRISAIRLRGGVGQRQALGGALGFVDLRLAFVASLLFALAQLAVSLLLREPPATDRADAIGRQLRRCGAALSDRRIGWLFFFGILMVTLEHLAFTMAQPWLTEVLGRSPSDLGSTPIVSGVTLAAVAVVGAGAARLSAPAAARFGTVGVLLALAAVAAGVVTAMAVSFHRLIIAVLLLRSVLGAAAPVLITAEVAPRIEQRLRATLFSLNSLAGRLGYGLLLWVVVDERVRTVLVTMSVIGWAMVAVLLLSALAILGVAGFRQRPPGPNGSASQTAAAATSDRK